MGRLRLVRLILVALVLAGCSGRNDAGECMRTVVDSPGFQLHGGVAVYGAKGGPIHRVSADGAAFLKKHRLASLTKPLVAARVRRLAESGRFQLDDPIWPLLPAHLLPESGGGRGITVRQLLQHTGGFDRSGARGDPLFPQGKTGNCTEAAKQVLASAPDFTPGSRTVYSNAGYCVLGELILAHQVEDRALDAALRSPLGGAGGYVSTIEEMHAALMGTLPLEDWRSGAPLPDGSYYSSGWRRRGGADGELRWTHFGRLPGLLSIAITDGEDWVGVAYFEGNPPDWEAAGLRLSRRMWQCSRKPSQG